MKVSIKKHLNFTIRRVKSVCCDNCRWSITRSNLIIDTSLVSITRTGLDESTNCKVLLYVIISIPLLFNLLRTCTGSCVTVRWNTVICWIPVTAYSTHSQHPSICGYEPLNISQVTMQFAAFQPLRL